MLVKPKITNGEFIMLKASYEKVDKQYRFMFGDHKDILFQINKCKLKYALNSDNKITIVHDSKIPEILHKHINELIGDKFASKCNSMLTLKVKDKNHINILKGVDGNSLLNVGIKFNNCWEISDNVYWSFELAHIQVLKNKIIIEEQKEDYSSYFTIEPEEDNIQ